MANVPTYISTNSATPPTADQNRTHQSMVADITGDGAATSIVLVHNWNLSTADQLQYPFWRFNSIGSGGGAALPFKASEDANSITFTCVAFTGKLVRAVLERPFTMQR